MMVINNLNVYRTWRAFWPCEANPPLVVDADAILAFPGTLKGLQVVARSDQISDGHSGVELLQLLARGSFYTGERFNPLACDKVSCALIPIADDHY